MTGSHYSNKVHHKEETTEKGHVQNVFPLAFQYEMFSTSVYQALLPHVICGIFSNPNCVSIFYCIVQMVREPNEPKFPPNLVSKRCIKNKIRLSTCSQTSFEAQKLHSASLRTQQALDPVGTRNGYYIHKHITLAKLLTKHPYQEYMHEMSSSLHVVIKITFKKCLMSYLKWLQLCKTAPITKFWTLWLSAAYHSSIRIVNTDNALCCKYQLLITRYGCSIILYSTFS